MNRSLVPSGTIARINRNASALISCASSTITPRYGNEIPLLLDQAASVAQKIDVLLLSLFVSAVPGYSWKTGQIRFLASRPSLVPRPILEAFKY